MSFSLRTIYKMSDQEAQAVFEFLRFGGQITCPRCGCEKNYYLATRQDYRCSNSNCELQFNFSSGTAFSGMKMDPKRLLGLCFTFVCSSNGTASTQMSRLDGGEQKTAYMTAMKCRRVLLKESQDVKLRGVVEIDGGIFGGHRKYESSVRPLFNKRLCKLMVKDRRCVVVAKQRMGRTRVFVGKKESDALAFLKGVVEQGSTIQVDGARAWDGLAKLGEMLRTEHLYTFGSNTQHTNNAESFFSAFRKMHRGVHHKMSGDNMLLYATELAWKRDNKDLSTDEKFKLFMRLALRGGKVETWRNIKSGKFFAENMLRAA